MSRFGIRVSFRGGVYHELIESSSFECLLSHLSAMFGYPSDHYIIAQDKTAIDNEHALPSATAWKVAIMQFQQMYPQTTEHITLLPSVTVTLRAGGQKVLKPYDLNAEDQAATTTTQHCDRSLYESSPNNDTKTRCVDLIFIGVGKLTRAVVEQLQGAREYYREWYGLTFRFKAFCDSTGAVFVDDKDLCLSDQLIASIFSWKVRCQSLGQHPHGRKTQVEWVLSTLTHSSSVVVDCSNASSFIMLPLFLQQISRGGAVVLANLKLLTQSVDDYSLIAPHIRKGRLAHSATVGTSILSALHTTLAANDQIFRIQGTFSGAIGFLMTGLESGTPFSELVQQAIQGGYLPPDPRDELAGTGVAHIALILARSFGSRLSMHDISMDSVFLSPSASVSLPLPLPDFLTSLSELNDAYVKRTEEAKAQGKVLRYVAVIELKQITVGIKAVDKNTPIGRCSGTETMVEFYTRSHYAEPLLVPGPAAANAGSATVAVLSDIVRITSPHP